MYNKTKIEATSQYMYVAGQGKRTRDAEQDVRARDIRVAAEESPRSSRSPNVRSTVLSLDDRNSYAHDYPFH